MQLHFGKSSRVIPVRTEKLQRAKSQLISDFDALLADAEELLRSTASASGEAVHGARSRLEDSVGQMKTRLSDAQRSMAKGFERTTAATQAYVHDNPWKVVGAAAAVGLLLGALIRRR